MVRALVCLQALGWNVNGRSEPQTINGNPPDIAKSRLRADGTQASL